MYLDVFSYLYYKITLKKSTKCKQIYHTIDPMCVMDTTKTVAGFVVWLESWPQQPYLDVPGS